MNRKLSGRTLAKRISIFLSINEQNLDYYFNTHDPAPLYKRQLSCEFEGYIMASVNDARKKSAIRFKLVVNTESDRQLAGPLLQAIRRHFTVKKNLKEGEFRRFKKRTYSLLAISMMTVMICQGLLPVIIQQQHGTYSSIINAINVFSWVILWKPVEKLIFYRSPFKKGISIFSRIAAAQVTEVEKEKEYA
ncbi:MAG: hypothetical protein SFU87_06265 [Chitinophagaceae bacterium]|nr:hypothetical protein [Chitinophagaceae bacterium]